MILALALLLADASPPPAAAAKFAAAANEAREAGQLDDAVRNYQKAVAAAPKWQEGWWYLGTLQYERGQYVQCRDAFRRFTALDAKLSPAFAMLGLCEFQSKDFAASLEHLERAFAMGLPAGDRLSAVTIYHIALLQCRASNFERAIQMCRLLVRRPDADLPNLIAVAGLAALRRPIFPHELPLEDRDLAFKLGNAMIAPGDRPIAEVERLFAEAVEAYPNEPNVHYSYATLLLANEPDRGVEELKKELAIDPEHLPALVSLAFEYLKRGEPAAARPYAEKAVAAAPGNFAARASLGRTLVELDELDAGIRELEMAAKLAPDSPQVFLSLGSAYAKAGRGADAARARAQFSKLKKTAREAPAGAPQ